MTEGEAQEIVTLINAATASRPDPKTLDYFVAAMMVLDFNVALATAEVGTVNWTKFPSWAQFKEIYRAQKRLAEPVGEQRDALPARVRTDPDFKRGVAAPDWCHIWYWSRIVKDPPDQRGFPQQEGFVNPEDQMSIDEYEKVRSEWETAGSPKYENPIPMAR